MTEQRKETSEVSEHISVSKRQFLLCFIFRESRLCFVLTCFQSSNFNTYLIYTSDTHDMSDVYDDTFISP